MSKKILLGEWRGKYGHSGALLKNKSLKERGTVFHVYKYLMWELTLSVEISHLMGILFKSVLKSLVSVADD